MEARAGIESGQTSEADRIATELIQDCGDLLVKVHSRFKSDIAAGKFEYCGIDTQPSMQIHSMLVLFLRDALHERDICGRTRSEWSQQYSRSAIVGLEKKGLPKDDARTLAMKLLFVYETEAGKMNQNCGKRKRSSTEISGEDEVAMPAPPCKKQRVVESVVCGRANTRNFL